MKKLNNFLFYLYFFFILFALLFKFGEVFTLTNWHPFATPFSAINFIPFAKSSMLAEILFNVVIFIPFGMLASGHFSKIRTVCLVIVLTSLSIESLQFIFSCGVSDITDLITNSLGGLLGVFAYKLGLREKATAILLILFLLALLALLTRIRFRA